MVKNKKSIGKREKCKGFFQGVLVLLCGFDLGALL